MSRQRNVLGQYSQETPADPIPCGRCGNRFIPRRGKRRFCSAECRKGADRYIDKMGYVVIKCPTHPHATTNGWVREHIVVACAKIGRPLAENEVVHHKDENKQNNHPDNLEVMTNSAHSKHHNPKAENPKPPKKWKYSGPNPVIICACGCGGSLEKFDNKGRERKYIRGHNQNDQEFRRR